MSQRKAKNSNIRKLMRTGRDGRSVGLTIPIDIVNDLKLRERQKVVVKKVGKRIVIEDWKP
jgi:antitoxin component of MazEF toxin-antitoxin module